MAKHYYVVIFDNGRYTMRRGRSKEKITENLDMDEVQDIIEFDTLEQAEDYIEDLRPS